MLSFSHHVHVEHHTTNAASGDSLKEFSRHVVVSFIAFEPLRFSLHPRYSSLECDWFFLFIPVNIVLPDRPYIFLMCVYSLSHVLCTLSLITVERVDDIVRHGRYTRK